MSKDDLRKALDDLRGKHVRLQGTDTYRKQVEQELVTLRAVFDGNFLVDSDGPKLGGILSKFETDFHEGKCAYRLAVDSLHDAERELERAGRTMIEGIVSKRIDYEAITSMTVAEEHIEAMGLALARLEETGLFLDQADQLFRRIDSELPQLRLM